jgi:hypothetical protein
VIQSGQRVVTALVRLLEILSELQKVHRLEQVTGTLWVSLTARQSGRRTVRASVWLKAQRSEPMMGTLWVSLTAR